MKRIISLIILTFFFIPTSFTCIASDIEEDRHITYFEDGSYIVETIELLQTREAGTVSGNNTKVYYSSGGVAEWKAALSGSFTYTGTASTCTASSVSITIYDSHWYTIAKSASKNSNTAIGLVTMGYKLLGVTTNQVSTDLSLSCDANGNLS